MLLKSIAHWNLRRRRRQLYSFQALPAQSAQLLVDISVISREDAGTGIQRIVRSILHELMNNPPAGYIVRPIAGTRKRPYYYIEWDRQGGPVQKKGLVEAKAGDVFLGLDLSASMFISHRRSLARWKKRGVAFHIVVYDLLPLHHPEWFPERLVKAFRGWIKTVTLIADSVLCISQVVKEDCQKWFADHYGLSAAEIPAYVIPMGWNFSSVMHSTGFPADYAQAATAIAARKTALMVGTIEPRKGHADVLDAFEQGWGRGQDYNLVIVGRPGWKTEALQARFRNHPEGGRRLFWFDNASDEALLALYAQCSGVIIASLAEGFGLPLIEALGHGKPVLARDLPVFRERAQPGIDYFPSGDSAVLSQAIAAWFDRLTTQPAQDISCQSLSSWQETVTALVNAFGRR